MSFLGPDSETALRATYAAGLQKRLWQFLDLLYRNQGAENSGWVTEDLLRSVGASIPGLDVNALMSARSTSNVDDALVASQQQSQSAKVTSTPTFFAGKTGGTLEHMNIGSLTPGAFTPTLDALTR
jgi:protein-disulfide isomerase